jgi:hypothetical protein
MNGKEGIWKITISREELIYATIEDRKNKEFWRCSSI